MKLAKFFCGVLINDTVNIDDMNTILNDEFGEIETISKISKFTETDYYFNEMGEVNRYWVVFKNLLEIDRLSNLKKMANEIEGKFSTDLKRDVNLDPGYLTAAKVVLASTKNFTHRIYIGNDIFAEVTLYYKKGTFREWPWSYADYKSKYGIDFFNGIRRKYMKDIKRKKEF